MAPMMENEPGCNGSHRPSFSSGRGRRTSSVFEDVEMAQNELFSGPVAESLPTSNSAFFHLREGLESAANFSYYDETQDDELEEGNEDEYFSGFEYNRSPDGDHDPGHDDADSDETSDEDSDESYLLARRPSSESNVSRSRRHSTHSRSSSRARLMHSDSFVSATSIGAGGRMSQKVYMASEDLTLVIAGFRTSKSRGFLYNLLCICTAGVAYLLLRWLPTWRIRFVGIPTALGECEWVVIENQWKEFAILSVRDFAYGRPLSTVFGATYKEWLPHDMDSELERLRIIDYRYVRFCYHPRKDKFVHCNGWQDPSWKNIRAVKLGLEGEERAHRELVFGPNLIDIEQKSTSQLLVDEVLHPFYVFQIASLVLWSMDEYYLYACCIFLMSVASIVTTLLETRANMKRLREISRFECEVRVLRNGFWRSVSSSDLVPGDVYELSDPNLALFPSDSLLISGDCIVNESMLTGESVPVSKVPANDKILGQLDLNSPSINPQAAKHFLFCGTKVVRVRRSQKKGHNDEAVALALVVRTGFNTTKGSLVRSMLFPKPSGFKFYRDSFRYISVMALAAMLGFIASFINFVRLRLAWHLIIVRALDLITIIVPPALPATLTIGTNFALTRLKQKQIFCISPQRVNVGGKVDMMCFDKTGTLTEEGLDIFGVRIVRRAVNRFSDVLDSPRTILALANEGSEHEQDAIPAQLSLLYTMATCHSLRVIDGELLGDPLDLKMFEFTGWSFEEGGGNGRNGSLDAQGSLAPSVARPPLAGYYTQRNLELGVIRTFEFISSLRRASVIVRQFGSQSADVYVKGAPECMPDICRQESFPADYDEQLAYYTHKGYRVIGCATKHINKLSWVKAQKMTRTEAESQLDFVGFIIFENKLKPTTAAVINELQASNISTLMCTGDNILTAVSVARECGLIDQNAHCFVPHFATGGPDEPRSELKWESIDNPLYQLDPVKLTPLLPPPEVDTSAPYDIANRYNFTIAVTGEVFRWVIDHARNPEVLRRMLVRGRVFARMSPDEKHELVERLQGIGYCCGFCGDGANDCGALKAADIGISLSEAEASVAAPFTSRVFDIRCVPTVIREGRAALVTSFSCFMYMSLYSAIQFTSVSLLYASASNLGDFQFLYIDLFLILPVAIFMSWAEPFPVLSRKRPTADLVSPKVLTPLLGQMVICILLQVFVFVVVRQQPWYVGLPFTFAIICPSSVVVALDSSVNTHIRFKPPHFNPNKSNIKNSENTVLFLLSCFEYILAGVVLNAGPPFRLGMLRNWPFVATLVVTVLTTALAVIMPPPTMKKWLQLTDMPMNFKLFLLGLGAVYFALAWAGEKYAFLPLARLIGKLTKKVKTRKEFKEIEDRIRMDL